MLLTMRNFTVALFDFNQLTPTEKKSEIHKHFSGYQVRWNFFKSSFFALSSTGRSIICRSLATDDVNSVS